MHGSLNFEYLFKDTQTITGIAGFGQAHFGDPAIDLAWINANASTDFMQQFLTSYARAGGENSPSLLERIEINGELVLLDWLLHGISEKNREIIEDAKLLITQLYESLLLDGKIELPDSTSPITATSSATEQKNIHPIIKSSSDISDKTKLSKEQLIETPVPQITNLTNTTPDKDIFPSSPSESPLEDSDNPISSTLTEIENNHEPQSLVATSTLTTDSNRLEPDMNLEAKIQDHLKTTPIEKTEMQEEANRSYWD